MSPIFLILIGLLALVTGAEALVRGSSRIAERMGVSPLVIGLTVVAFGTSLPELVVSLRSAIAGSPGIALGNVVGSNICNVGLILGIAALIHPARLKPSFITRDIPLLVVISLVTLVFLWNGRFGRLEGGLFVFGLVVYLLVLWRVRPEGEETPSPSPKVRSGAFWPPVLLVVGSLIILVVGAQWLMAGASELARGAGISEAVVGLTLVAIGTSLPELATSTLAAFKGKSELAVGNVIGSNIFNLLGILGITAVVHPVDFGGITRVDLAVMLGFALILLPMARSGFRINRWEGSLLLLLFAAYLTRLFLFSSQAG